MCCYTARRREDGRWIWAQIKDAQVVAAQPCCSHPDGHATKEEAARHFYDYCCAHLHREILDIAERCVICNALTDLRLTSPLGGVALCDYHCTAQDWVAAIPFTEELKVILVL